jgi:arylsulfatase A
MSFFPRVLGCLLALLIGSSALAAERPNILIILADDLGLECLSAYGGESHKTPHLDQLAREGMRFTHCFSHPYCSPSRASLITGRYPFLHGLKQVLFDETRHADLWLRTDQPSFARQLRQAGYATAIAGKWQLSFLHQNNNVNAMGFDRYQCWQIFRPDGTRSRRFFDPHFLQDGVIRRDIAEKFGPDLNVEYLTEFLRECAENPKPFLAYYTSLLPHFPWVPTPDGRAGHTALPDESGAGDPKFFPGMVRHLDRQVGTLLATVDRLGLAERTIVFFLADNGTDPRLSHLWRGRKVPGGKGTMTDRGTRVPLIVRWPGQIAAGSVCHDLVDFSDFLPTLCELAGAPLPEVELHGRSFAPQLRGRPGRPREWVLAQDKERQFVRNREFLLPSSGSLRPVVELSEDPAPPIHRQLTPKESAAQSVLRAALTTGAPKPTP